MGTKISYLGNEIASIDQDEIVEIKDKLATTKELSTNNTEQIPQDAKEIEKLRSEIDLAKDIMGGAFDSWADVQRIVRKGQAAQYFKIGDQLVCGKTIDGVTQKLVWDIIGIDHDTPSDSQFTHSLTLQLHDCYTELQFDATEALFAFPDGLVAGTYYFTIDNTYAATYNDYMGYQFTLTKDIPAGGIIMFPWGYNKNASTTKLSSYASTTATTAIEIVSTSNGTTGTNLGNVTRAGDKANNINAIERVRYGSNNYRESAMRQYLNSSKAAGAVWTPQTKFDRAPAWANNTAGFLYGVDPEFISTLGMVKKVTALNNISDGGGSEETDEKIFLVSRTEVYGGNEVSGGEGKPYAYYSDYSEYTAANGGEDTNRIKQRNGAAKYWWLRPPVLGYAHIIRLVGPSGIIDSDYAMNIYGVAPACCII